MNYDSSAYELTTEELEEIIRQAGRIIAEADAASGVKRPENVRTDA